tara:strand:- start:367 stop:513 length:147 start_codon:yes stop_codon:yes gene_type:complete
MVSFPVERAEASSSALAAKVATDVKSIRTVKKMLKGFKLAELRMSIPR